MATIQKRVDTDGTPKYRVQVRLKGHPPQTATFARRTDAKLWAHQTETAIREGCYFKAAEAKCHTFGDMIDRYLREVLPGKGCSSVVNQSAQLLWWRRELGDVTLADVTAARIVEKRNERCDLSSGCPHGASERRYELE